MLAAEIRGKISRLNPPHNRMEDVLTSSVLSLFQYLDQCHILAEILRESISVSGERLQIHDIYESEVLFWPRCAVHGRTREADALIRIQEGKSTGPVYLLVEAKYGSGLSNIGIPPEGDEQLSTGNEVREHQFCHQLADEYCCIKCGQWLHKFGGYGDLEEAEKNMLLYITSHYECPESDLRDCADIIRGHKTCDKKACGGNAGWDIYWLGWRQIYSVIINELKNYGKFYSTGENRLINDVLKILEIRDLIPFDVFKKLRNVGLSRSISIEDKLHKVRDPGQYTSFIDG